MPSLRWRAASSMVSPAPISSTVDSSRRANEFCARRTAVEATETGLAPTRVSVRARLATAKVCWNRRSRRVAQRAVSRARRPRPPSPGRGSAARPAPSNPGRWPPGTGGARRRHRCAGTGSPPVLRRAWPASAPSASPSSAMAYSSVRLQVDSTAASDTSGSARSEDNAAGSAAASNATRSRRPTGAVWWLIPSTHNVIVQVLALSFWPFKVAILRPGSPPCPQ